MTSTFPLQLTKSQKEVFDLLLWHSSENRIPRVSYDSLNDTVMIETWVPNKNCRIKKCDLCGHQKFYGGHPEFYIQVWWRHGKLSHIKMPGTTKSIKALKRLLESS